MRIRSRNRLKTEMEQMREARRNSRINIYSASSFVLSTPQVFSLPLSWWPTHVQRDENFYQGRRSYFFSVTYLQFAYFIVFLSFGNLLTIYNSSIHTRPRKSDTSQKYKIVEENYSLLKADAFKIQFVYIYIRSMIYKLFL